MQVGTKVLGYGSGGTVVLEGHLDGRPVAVKRLLARFAELARTEIKALIHTDDHPNVVRLQWKHVVQRDRAFWCSDTAFVFALEDARHTTV